ncbi:MFS transporter [Schaalia sp. Marseille-Q2122]|uniref:MFS transporter n=1 Tax=Schaalia sp. Marseille-Q2122 TaxID=2736604 RepID=UPI00158C943B|nr:MFS transporter [Schaalia sp. Marseille-Q2122]
MEHQDSTATSSSKDAAPRETHGATETSAPADASRFTHWKRTVTLFLVGQSISMFGSSIVQFAVMWYLTLETQSGLVVMLYAIFAFVPQGLLSLFGGTLADRMNRKLLIIIPDAIIAITTLALALIMVSGITDLWIILAAVTIRSIGSGFQNPAVSAAIPSIVPADQLMRVNGINASIQGVMALLSPAAGGAIYGLGGIVPTFFVDVVTAVIGIGVMAFVPIPKLPDNPERKSLMGDLFAGLHYTFTHRFIRWLLTVYAVVFVLIVAPNFLVPLMVTRSFGGEVWMLTGVEVAFSLGMALGGMLVGMLIKRSKMHLLLVSSVIFGLLGMAMGVAPNVYVVLALNATAGLLVPVFSTPSTTALQEHTDPAFMGRVFSLVSIVFTLGMPLGMAVFGPLADTFSVETILIGTGAVTILFVLFSFYGLADGRHALAESRAEQRALETHK